MEPTPSLRSEMTNTSNTPRSESGSLWVFRQLWRAGCLPNLDEGAPSFYTGIRLRVAATILIDDDGWPQWWLTTTQEGRLRGQKLMSTPRGAQDGQRAEPHKRMRHAVDIMRQFWEHTNNGGPVSTGGPTCIVRLLYAYNTLGPICYDEVLMRRSSGAFCFAYRSASCNADTRVNCHDHAHFTVCPDPPSNPGSGVVLRWSARASGHMCPSQAVLKRHLEKTASGTPRLCGPPSRRIWGLPRKRRCETRVVHSFCIRCPHHRIAAPA